MRPVPTHQMLKAALFVSLRNVPTIRQLPACYIGVSEFHFSTTAPSSFLLADPRRKCGFCCVGGNLGLCSSPFSWGIAGTAEWTSTKECLQCIFASQIKKKKHIYEIFHNLVFSSSNFSVWIFCALCCPILCYLSRVFSALTFP